MNDSNLSKKVFKMASKYKNKKIEVNGILFDSKKEARRYEQLLMLEKSGEITDLQMQVKFVLIPAQYGTVQDGHKMKRKCLEREVTYVADFVYRDKQQKLHVEDTKNPYLRKEPRYVIKRKMMLYFHGIRIEEI